MTIKFLAQTYVVKKYNQKFNSRPSALTKALTLLKYQGPRMNMNIKVFMKHQASSSSGTERKRQEVQGLPVLHSEFKPAWGIWTIK